jgi:hypothetical protein
MLRRDPPQETPFGPATFRAFALAALFAGGLAAAPGADAASLAEKARESGCVGKPSVVEGNTYRCVTESGAFSYFNVPGSSEPLAPAGAAPRVNRAVTPAPAGFPKVDSATQKGRDDIRRKVLGDELASEEKLLVEARAAYADGAPVPLAEERNDAEKYRARIARLRQAVSVHERNIEALRKEIGSTR